MKQISFETCQSNRPKPSFSVKKLTKTPINFSYHTVNLHNDAYEALVQKDFWKTRLVNPHRPNQHIISVFPILFPTLAASHGIPEKNN